MVFGEGCNISPTPKISPSLKWLSNPKMHRTIILQNANRACCCNPCVTKTFRTAPIGAQLIPRCSPPLLPAVSGDLGPPLQCSKQGSGAQLIPAALLFCQLSAWNLRAPLPLHLSEHTLDCTRKLRSLQKEKIEGSRKRQAALLQGTHHKQTPGFHTHFYSDPLATGDS